MAHYLVISENKNKVGEYYLIGFRNYKPVFESSMWLGRYKRYKTLKGAEKAKAKVDGYYKNMPQISTRVETIK